MMKNLKGWSYVPTSSSWLQRQQHRNGKVTWDAANANPFGSFHGLQITGIIKKSQLASAKVICMISHWISLSRVDYLSGEQEGERYNMPPPSWVPVCLSEQKLRALCSTATALWGSWELLWTFSTLPHQSQISHCSGLMQNAITFSIRTSLSREVKGKHISHCVPAALILLMAKTPWRQIVLSLFRKLWVKRKHIWHLYSMRGLSI